MSYPDQKALAIRNAIAPVLAPFADGIDATDFVAIIPKLVPALMRLRGELNLTGAEAHALVVDGVTQAAAYINDHDATWCPNWIESPLDSLLTSEFVQRMVVVVIEREFNRALAILPR